HENVSWFMIDADLPGITIQPMDLLGTGGEAGTDSRQKQTVYFDDVRVPACALIGGENNGWKVASTHLELEHGGGGRIGRNRLWERLIAYCKETTRDGVPLVEHQDVRDTLAEIYIKCEVQRLFGLRNFWLTYNHEPRSYEGPQLSMHRKSAGLWMTGAILAMLGPSALTTDEVWGSPDDFLENQQRSGIVATHPGGTIEVQKVSMARRIGQSLTDVAVLFEELGRGPLPGPFFSSSVLGALTLLEAGTEEQKRRLLPDVAEGETVLTVAVSDPRTSWGPQGVTLRAERR